MSKYTPLAQYLSNLDVNINQVKISFNEIENIIDKSLPRSAHVHERFWENDKKGTHYWSILWRLAGWTQIDFNLAQQFVVFKRISLSISEILNSLRPLKKENIYDLVKQANISTNEWHFTEKLIPVNKPKSNPHYCSNWSFGSQEEGYVLNIWFDTLEIENEQIIFDENLKALAADLQLKNQTSSDSKIKQRSIAQAKRANAFDIALKTSYERGLPVSVIINAGSRREREELGDSTSKVTGRFLDPMKWYVHNYSSATGDSLLVRGVEPLEKSTKSDDDIDNYFKGKPDLVQLKAIKIRQGQHDFRKELLAAYGRKCAVTGCTIVELLEAAHIEPHRESANYHVTNGLLLRADIHTLYDLNLLTIDSKYKVSLAPPLLNSEYKMHNNKLINLPELPSEIPYHRSLETRYSEFQKKNNLN